MAVWVSLGSSFTLVLVLAWLTRYYRAKLIKIRQGKSTDSIEKITFEDAAILENDDGQNIRYSNSSTSGEFENVFPYREQIEHFLSATRDLRKSRQETKYYSSIRLRQASVFIFPEPVQHPEFIHLLHCTT